MRVVLDTNALLLPFTDGTDLVHELEGLLGAVELVVPTSVVHELEQLRDGAGQTARAAQAALRLAHGHTIEGTALPGDDGVLDVARRVGRAVVTNDRRLGKEAKRAGLTVVQSRGHGRLHVA